MNTLLVNCMLLLHFEFNSSLDYLEIIDRPNYDVAKVPHMIPNYDYDYKDILNTTYSKKNKKNDKNKHKKSKQEIVRLNLFNCAVNFVKSGVGLLFNPFGKK